MNPVSLNPYAHRTPPAFSAPSTGTSQRQRLHQVAHNFQAFLGARSAQVQTEPIERLVSRLDCQHCDGSKYAVVSVRHGGAGYVTTVLDVPLRKIYRAEHRTGMATFWKGLAQRRAAFVQHVGAHQAYLPEAVA
jgi:hypothetical protein